MSTNRLSALSVDRRPPEGAPLSHFLAYSLRQLHIEPVLALLLMAIMGFGLVVLYSASNENLNQVSRQVVRLTAAVVAMVIVAQISAGKLKQIAPAMYAAGLLMLISVIFFGYTSGGATRWLDFGAFRFQPSEMMKIAMPLMLAWLLSEDRLPPNMLRVAAGAALIAVPMALIVVQPDLGTAILIGSSGVFVLFFSGIRWRWIGLAAAAVAAMMPVIWAQMHGYQRQRVLTFLNPEADPLGSGYHIIQSKIAIGSGGVFGKGWLEGTQSQLDFLPERATDFIFSVACEEFGLLGVLPLLILYAAIVLRGLYIAATATDHFSRLLAGSLSLTFCVYVLVNIGMVSGLLPVVGVPLPLISYGGSSMITIMTAFGILMSIHTHKSYESRY